MSYGIVRVQKFQSGGVKGIETHDRRKKDHSHTNKEIDFERSKLNYDLHPTAGTFRQTVKERINELNLKKAVRKDAVVMAQVLVTSDKNFFEKLTPEQTKEFFKESYDFLKERYGRQNIVSAIVHMDETTPHMHFNFVPVTKDNRLSAKTLFNRNDLIQNHDDFYKQIGIKWGLNRGEREGYKKHLDVAKYKKKTAFEEIKSIEVERNTIKNNLKALQNDFEQVKGLKFDFDKIDGLEVKTGLLNKHKVTLEEKDFTELKLLAKKSQLLVRKIEILESENSSLRNSLDKFKSSYSITKEIERNRELIKKSKELDLLKSYIVKTKQIEQVNNFIKQISDSKNFGKER